MNKKEKKTPLSAGLCTLLSSLIVIIAVFLDQYTKLLAAAYLKGKEAVSLIPGILELKYLYPENRGIAFGMFQRSEERRVGKECRIGCRSRWSPYH